jgi:hypothetical protein
MVLARENGDAGQIHRKDLTMNIRRSNLILLPLAALAFGACGAESGDDDSDDFDDFGSSDQEVVTAESAPKVEIEPLTDNPATTETSSTLPDNGETTQLSADMTWQWQLQGAINGTYDADVYDIDLFDTPSSVIDELHDADRLVICYFSAGSYEEWREDAAEFVDEDLGESLDGWEGERWVDIRSESIRSVMQSRLDLAAERGCDGVEPDNVTAHNNSTGFDIGAEDQLSFNTFLADSSRERGLLVGLKNDLIQIPELVALFDFAVNEECVEYDECDAYGPFVDAGKPVFGAEYSEAALNDPDATCAAAAAAGLTALILPLDLDDSFRISCN